MASNRIGRINEEIQKELSSLLRNLKDPRVQDTMISITRVETTPDLPGAGSHPESAVHSGNQLGVGRFHHLRCKNAGAD